MHASNKITLENVKDAIYFKQPDATQQAKIDKINLASEALMRVILENVQDCADRTVALREARLAHAWSLIAVWISKPTDKPDDKTSGEALKESK